MDERVTICECERTVTAENKKQSEMEFPEGKIVMFDGKELTCYPVEQPKETESNELSLDTTGTYLQIGRKPVRTQEEIDEEAAAQRQLLIDNAYLFYKNASRILSDSRMFLAPVTMDNGLAYTGTSGFRNPTLGVYIEWWLCCPQDITHDLEGQPALTYFFAGSPLSGMNSCSAVTPEGKTIKINYGSFREVWQSFMRINRRYDEAKGKYEAYTLKEVRDLLKEGSASREAQLETEMLILKGNNFRLQLELKNERDRLEAERENHEKEVGIYCAHLQQCYKTELEEFKTAYMKRKKEVEDEQQQFKEQRLAYRKEMKQGLITPKQYQQTITPLRKQLESLERSLIRYEWEECKRIGKMSGLTGRQISDYLKNGPLSIPERNKFEYVIY